MRNDAQVNVLLEKLASALGRVVEVDRSVATPLWPQLEQNLLHVRPVEGEPLTRAEESLVRELILGEAREARLRGEVEGLDQRLRQLERENLELASRNRALLEQSARDALTGLYARWYLFEKIDAELNRALRTGSPVSLLMLDIDHFKRVNDSLGHQAGDQLLQRFGHMLGDSCRVYDMPGRYGGDEFCLLLPETPNESTVHVAERIRRRVALNPLSIGGQSVHVTTSIGVASVDSSDSGVFDAASLIERADRALYQAKDRGRNRVETWDRVSRGTSQEH